jgi:hypothetical protein
MVSVDWNRSPLNVINVNGQLVTYDNRRLDAALEAGLDKVKVTIVDPNSPHPDSFTGKHGGKNSSKDSEIAEILKPAELSQMKV